jgi:hypothetical protein
MTGAHGPAIGGASDLEFAIPGDVRTRLPVGGASVVGRSPIRVFATA